MLHQLELRTLVLGVHLGCGADERKEPQEVAFTVTFRFSEMPKACVSDELGESIDYSQVSDAIVNAVSGREFKMIEHLAYVVFQSIKSIAETSTKSSGVKDVAVRLEIHKLNPPVRDLRGGSLYTMGEF